MTKEEIIRMAREAGAWVADDQHSLLPFLERFAALVAAAAVRETSAEYRMGWNDGQINEREACAKVCDDIYAHSIEDWEGADRCGDEIRARGQT